MRAGAAFGCDREHLGAESGDHPIAERHLTGIENIEISRHRLQGTGALRRCLTVTRSDAQEEATRVTRDDPMVGIGELGRFGLPDVDDSRRDDDELGAVQELLSGAKVRSR